MGGVKRSWNQPPTDDLDLIGQFIFSDVVIDPALVDARVSDGCHGDLEAPSLVMEVDVLVVLWRDEVSVPVPFDLRLRDAKHRAVQGSRMVRSDRWEKVMTKVINPRWNYNGRS